MSAADRVPGTVKVLARGAAAGAGRATHGLRMTPRLLVVGAQRCGTTSLFRALAQHPHVVPPLWHKGIHYFDTAERYARGPQWYRGHFPLRAPAARSTRPATPLTLEASPYYMFHPLAAERIARELPGTKVVVLLRDPVQRAWSAFKQETGRGFEDQPFERALDLEQERLAGEVERMVADPTYSSFGHQHHAYVARGRYAEQIRRLQATLGEGSVLVQLTDELFGPDRSHWSALLEFAGLDAWDPGALPRANSRPSGPMPDGARQRLEAALEASDADLEVLLGRSVPWTGGR